MAHGGWGWREVARMAFARPLMEEEALVPNPTRLRPPSFASAERGASACVDAEARGARVLVTREGACASPKTCL
ncbi:hypothetical protein QQF64_006524 [Cirrhinus molitorella]|uniref:Uncharacterized protein n=1 Tax=Cirrhinus molitorella TaxID=172907 RepID=A0ABR3M828_9TELE